MLNAIVVSIRFIPSSILSGQKQVALENAALRHQLAVFKHNGARPKLNNRDRLFWIVLCMIVALRVSNNACAWPIAILQAFFEVSQS